MRSLRGCETVLRIVGLFMREFKLFKSERDHLSCKYLCFCIDTKTVPSFDGFVDWLEENGYIDSDAVRETFMEDVFCAEV
jgi:hypothetical protein